MKKLILIPAFLGVFLLVFTAFKSGNTSSNKKSNTTDVLKDGDIIFQTTRSRQCKAVQAATHSKFSHCGIIFIENGKPMVYEAIQPVKITPLASWITRGTGLHYTVTRLKNADSILTKENIVKMKSEAKKMLGKNYDSYFGWNDDLVYCSELVWKIYKRGADYELCSLKKLKDFDLSNNIVKEVMQERYGSVIPYDESMVSPADLYQSKKTITVIEK